MKPSRQSAPSSNKTGRRSDTSLPYFCRSLVKRVQHFAQVHELWEKNEALIVAVSGGADSLCLLDVLAYLKEKYHFTLTVAHVNYGLRGKDSDKDEALVRERAALYQLPCEIYHLPKKERKTDEEFLRSVRYRFFEALLQKNNAHHIVVAHHLDDQAETFLLRLLRGSGTIGLSGMLPQSGHVIRPFLSLRRDELVHYLTLRKLSYRTDRSNSDPRYLRNRVRHELLPLLTTTYQPRIVSLLAQTAESLASDRAILEEFSRFLPYSLHKNGLTFSLKDFSSLSTHLQPHILRFLITTLSPGSYPSRAVIQELKKTLKSSKSKIQKLSFHGLKLVRKGDTVRLLKSPE